MKTIGFALCAATATLTPAISFGAPTLLSGHRLGFQWYYSTLDQPYDPATVVEVDPTGNFYIDHSQLTLTLTDNQIRVQSSLSFSSHFNAGPFNGFVLTDINGTIPDFEEFTIDAETNLAGFSNSRVTLAPNSIAVNFQNLSNRPGMVVSLTLAGHNVPEPTPLGLLIASAVALVLARRIAKGYQAQAGAA